MAKGTGSETIIAHGVRVQGDFVSEGDIIIEGEVTGNITTKGDVRIGSEAKIRADIAAENAVFAGDIQGNIKISGRSEFTETARLKGDVTAQVLAVAAGARLVGKITIGDAAAEASEDDAEE